MTQLALTLFGAPQAVLDGAPLHIRLRKALALLAYLAVEQRLHTRDALATLLWPGYGRRDAHANLRRTLAVLRHALSGEWLAVGRQQISLNRAAGVWVDVLAFRQVVDQPSSSPAHLDELVQAVSLYTGDFLAGFSLADAPEFDDWQRQEGDSLRQSLALALDRLVTGQTAAGRPELALAYAQRRVDLDALHEPAQRQLMRLYAANGQPAAALRQYEICARQLRQELGVEPSAETTQLQIEIRTGRWLQQQDKDGAFAGQAAITPAALGAAQVHLPAQPSPLIGRENELAGLRRLLLSEPGCRLLTLLGPGGIGKTRLALAVAHHLAHAFPDGVVFVPFAGVNSIQHLDSTLAEAVQFTFSAEPAPRQQLLHYFRNKRMLLVMDNFEHLLDGVDLLTGLLHSAPGVTLLVTSRERLGLAAEWVYDLAGLAYPESVGGPHGASLETLESFGAPALFVARAQRHRAGYTLTAADASHVLRLCQMVDGMPLALELAAVWMRLMSPAEIVRRLSAGFDFLAGGLRDLPARHRSLAAVVDHSWQMLSPQEQTAFCSLAVFRGGFTVDAAQAVASATPSLLLSLIDKSLLRRLESGRYEIHEMLRQVAQEKLSALPEQQAAVTAAHAHFYARLLAERQPDLHTHRQQTAAAEIALELDNIRQAWPFPAVRDHDLLWMAGGGLLFYIELRGLWREFETAFAVLAQELRQPPGPSPDPSTDPHTATYRKIRLMTALSNQTSVDLRLGHPQVAAQRIDEYRRLFRELEPIWPYPQHTTGWYSLDAWRGWGAYIQGLLAVGQGAYAAAYDHLSEALSYLRRAEMSWGAAGAQLVLGQIARAQGEYGAARAFFESCLAAYETIGDRRQTAAALDQLGRLALLLGDWQAAAHACRRSLALHQAVGDAAGAASSRRHLGEVALAQGDHAQAHQEYAASLQLCREIGQRLGQASSLAHLGELALLQGDADTATRLLEEALALWRKAHHRLGEGQTLLLLAQGLHQGGERSRAQALIQESLTQAEALGSRWLLAQAHAATGSLAQAQQDWRGAEAHFRQALAQAARLQAPPAICHVLVTFVPLLCESDRSMLAGRILATVLAHPAAAYPTRVQAQQALAERGTELPSPLEPLSDLDELLAAVQAAWPSS